MQLTIQYQPLRYFGNFNEAKRVDLETRSYSNDRISISFNYAEPVLTSGQDYAGHMKGGQIVLSRESALILVTAILRACTYEGEQDRGDFVRYTLKE